MTRENKGTRVLLVTANRKDIDGACKARRPGKDQRVKGLGEKLRQGRGNIKDGQNITRQEKKKESTKNTKRRGTARRNASIAGTRERPSKERR